MIGVQPCALPILTGGREQDVTRMELAVPASHNELRLWYEGFGFTTMGTREPMESRKAGLGGEPGEPVTWMSRTLRPATVRPVRRRFTDPAKPCAHPLMACACMG